MTRRLQAVRVGNFKAFADSQRIPLKPITLVFGPNSAGKSSFIHSLALAHEAQFGREKRSLSRLDIHHTDIGGSSIDLGGFRQFVHRGLMSKRVEWGAEIKVSTLVADRSHQQLAQLLSSIDVVGLNVSLGIELDDQDRPVPGAEPHVESIEIVGDESELLRMSRRRATTTDDHGTALRVDRLSSDHAVVRQILKAILEANTTSLEIRPEDFESADEAIAALLPELVVRVDQFLPSSVELPRTEGVDIPRAHMLFAVSKGNRQEDIAQAVRFLLPRALSDLVKGLSDALAAELKQLQYLGPLRSFPPRHLAFAENEDANWYAGGGYAWDVVRRDDNVRAAVNGWLGDNDKLKTPYRLEVRSLVDTRNLKDPIEHALDHPVASWVSVKDVEWLLGEEGDVDSQFQPLIEASDDPDENMITLRKGMRDSYAKLTSKVERDKFVHKAWVELNRLLAESDEGMEPEADLAREAQNAVDIIDRYDVPKLRDLVLVDIRKDTVVTHRDVGIGISQVLPVLVMAYASKGKLLAMEQPEIHLHPALQAELADVFIQSALGESKNTFILETHSEHLILRLMRRVREGKISPTDISVIFVDPQSHGSRFMELRIDEEGDFIDEWPGGFFEESFHEKFAGR